MRKLLYAATVLGLVSFQSANAIAQEREKVLIYNGYMTGEDCHAGSENLRASYMMGIVDGLFVSPFLGAPDQRLKPLNQCLGGVTSTQLGATLKKWLDENPEYWHYGCHIAAIRALRQICKGI